MVCAGVEAEEFAVRHVREPGEWMPVARVAGGEGPFDSRPRQSFLHGGIFRDVILIVVIHKTVVRRRQISQQRDECEQQANETRTGLRRAVVLTLESRTGVFRAGFLAFAVLASATQAGHRVLCMRFVPTARTELLVNFW